MNTARLHAPRDIRLQEEADPTPAPGEELVRVTGVGLCGSDLHWYQEGGIGDAGLARPLILGHEIGGVIAAGPREGTRVAIDPADPCGRCRECLAGQGHLCNEMRFSGHGRTDGGLRSLMAWPAALLHPIPSGIPDVEAPLLEPLGVALHAVDLGHVRPGMSAGVYGCGPIGLLLVSLLAGIGAGPIFATDLLEHRVIAAREMGAADAQQAGAASSGRPPGDDPAWPEVDVAFEAAGTDDAIATAVRSVRPGGRVVLVGIPGEDRSSYPASEARRKGLTLMLSRRMTGHDLPRAIRLVDAGVVRLGPLISARYPLADAAAAFTSLAERRGLKIVVQPST